MKQRKIHNCLDGCSVESTLQLISGKWKCVLLYHLIFEGAYRYSELQRFYTKTNTEKKQKKATSY